MRNTLIPLDMIFIREDRTILGIVENRLLYVAYTMRGEKIRLISARGAEPHEHRRYHEENS
jgi:uncharacterized DUF497 family protein